MLEPQVVVQHCENTRCDEDGTLKVNDREHLQVLVVNKVSEDGEEGQQPWEPIKQQEEHVECHNDVYAVSEELLGGNCVFFHHFGHVEQPGCDGQCKEHEPEDHANVGEQLEQHCVCLRVCRQLLCRVSCRVLLRCVYTLLRFVSFRFVRCANFIRENATLDLTASPADEVTSTTVTNMKRVAAETQAVKKARITDFFKKKSDGPVVAASVTAERVMAEDNKLDTTDSANNYSLFKQQFVKKLSPEHRTLLELEINTLEDSWFQALHKELTKPYFIALKKYLKQQRSSHKVFPPEEDVYSWSRLTPLTQVKCIILGQDPYHNDNQAHGLAFSVKDPTPPPPSLKNMFKALKLDYPQFDAPKSGDLTHWAEQGVLMLNACLTVRAHEANSHAKRGWEQFTESVLKVALSQNQPIVLLLWGTPAQKRVEKMNLQRHHALRTVHPSPLSARRGFFEAQHFKKCNDRLKAQGNQPINWSLLVDNVIDY